jgi:hypothetical protein
VSQQPPRWSLQKGFERLLGPEVTEHMAAERIEKAAREGPLLYCNGKPVDPSFVKTHLRIVARKEQEPARDKRPGEWKWKCRVVPAGPLGWEPIPGPVRPGEVIDYSWEVDAERIETVRGMWLSPTGRWTTAVDDEIWRLLDRDSPLVKSLDDPKNLKKLYGHVTERVTERTGAPPKYPKKLRRRVRDRLGINHLGIRVPK